MSAGIHGTRPLPLPFATIAVACALLWSGSALAVERDAWLARVERSRQQSAAFIGALAERHASLAHPRAIAVVADGSVRAMDDPTLRYGDIIVRAGGLVVFRGAPGEQRSESDFRELAAEQLGGVHDSELLALDAVVRIAQAGE